MSFLASMAALGSAAAAGDTPIRLGFAPPPATLPAMSDGVPGVDGEADDTTQFNPLTMPDTNPAVAPLLASHPGEELVLCVAGCGRPSVVQSLRKARPKAQTVARFLPASGPGASSTPGQMESGDIVCIAGCIGEPGEVVHNIIRLSWVPERARSSMAGKLEALSRHLAASSEDRKPKEAAVEMRTWLTAAARSHLLGRRDPVSLAAVRRRWQRNG